MYKILIVDDEYWVGRWITEVLKNVPGMEVADVCQDGEEAQQFMKTAPVDILITDINMPILNGLDLIRGTGELKRMPEAIVISGYDEFEYARQAIELEVLAYLLKPLEKTELLQALEKAAKKIGDRREQSQHSRLGYYAEIENLLSEFFQHPQDRLRKKLDLSFMRKDFKEKYFMIGMIQNANLEVSPLPKEELRKKLEEASRGRAVFLIRRNPHTWSFMIAGIENGSGFYLDNSVLYQILKDCFWGISEAHMDLTQLEEADQEAKAAILTKLGGKEGSGSVGEFLTDRNDEFLSAINTRDKEKIVKCCETLSSDFRNEPYHLTSCLNFYFVLAGEVIKMLSETYKKQQNVELLDLIDEGYEFSVQIRDFYSISAICRHFEEYSLRVIDTLNRTGPLSVNDIVQRVKGILRERYGADLNLGSLADEFDINPSYLSKKFKDETGINFVDYLARVRIEQAQSLLRHTELSIANISGQVGFNDPKYFSKVFLALTGFKPSEYRSRPEEERE